MPSPAPPSLPTLWQALFGGGGLMVLAVFLRETLVWMDGKRKAVFDRLQSEADKNKADAAAVEIARLHEKGEVERRGEEAAWRLADERKGELAQIKSEFSAQIGELKQAVKDEGEERKLVMLAADAAHIRADEAVRHLEVAKRERDAIAEKLAAVETRAAKAEQLSTRKEKEKSLEIERLNNQLSQANRKIEDLERYIREHKMTVSLQRGEEIITASMMPMEPSDTPPSDAPAPGFEPTP